MNKNFSEILEGQRFTFNSKEYIKIPSVKVSCCKSFNAQAADNANEKIYVNAGSTVTVNA